MGNLIIGGVIAVGVDAATGAINEYPGTFQVPMQADPNASRSEMQLYQDHGKPMS